MQTSPRPSRGRIVAATTAGLGALILLSGCVVEAPPRERVVQRQVVVRQPAPPPLRAERPPPPEYASNWDPGRWQWNGHEYVWVEGRTVERAGRPPAAVWVPGRWEQRGFGWEWQEGHWR